MGFQKIYTIWGVGSASAQLWTQEKLLRVDGRVDGRTDEGSIRGPRGPKKATWVCDQLRIISDNYFSSVGVGPGLYLARDHIN